MGWVPAREWLGSGWGGGFGRAGQALLDPGGRVGVLQPPRRVGALQRGRGDREEGRAVCPRQPLRQPVMRDALPPRVDEGVAAQPVVEEERAAARLEYTQ